MNKHEKSEQEEIRYYNWYIKVSVIGLSKLMLNMSNLSHACMLQLLVEGTVTEICIPFTRTRREKFTIKTALESHS